MNYLTRWDPFREMMTIRNMMDRLVDETFSTTNASPTWGLPIDVAENENEFVVKVSAPGVNPDDLEISFSGDTLTIKGEVKEDKDVDEERYHIRERRFGSFARSLTLPTKVNSDQIEAAYENGVLTLRLPKAEEVRPRRIAIQGGNEKKVIEGNFQKGK
ncbi:MAG: Hsp20/alpha crystallin family protein [Chloroflexota bacterium]|nr:MAG: Hsp20/alpha crystallin family protein [Chloroflexota bacterium]